MTLHNKDQEAIQPQWKARLQDLLSTPTRGKRRLLLLASTTSLIFVVLGLFPTKIEALGITFENKDRTQMILLIGAVNVYALIGFFLYAWGDFHLLKRSYDVTTTGYLLEFIKGRASVLESLNFYARVLFDFALPIVYGLYAIWSLYEALRVSMVST